MGATTTIFPNPSSHFSPSLSTLSFSLLASVQPPDDARFAPPLPPLQMLPTSTPLSSPLPMDADESGPARPADDPTWSSFFDWPAEDSPNLDQIKFRWENNNDDNNNSSNVTGDLSAPAAEKSATTAASASSSSNEEAAAAAESTESGGKAAEAPT